MVRLRGEVVCTTFIVLSEAEELAEGGEGGGGGANAEVKTAPV